MLAILRRPSGDPPVANGHDQIAKRRIMILVSVSLSVACAGVLTVLLLTDNKAAIPISISMIAGVAVTRVL